MNQTPQAGVCAGCVYRRLVRDVGHRCCRHSPVVVVTEGGIESVFPAVPADSWCGDFAPAAPAPAAVEYCQ